jgi:UDP-N-acetylglucosamine diphosphorylase/glucosamine-1-phosphate N-acetyltransferase
MNIPSLTGGSFADDFFPFSQTRSVADFRIGILTIREKWEKLLENHLTLPAGLSIPSHVIPDPAFIQSIVTGNIVSGLEQVKKLLNITDMLHLNGIEIKKDFELITAGRKSSPVSQTNKLTGTDIFLEPGAIVEHCFLNAAEGPIYIGKDSLVMEGSMIRGPFSIGEKGIVKMGAKIYGATSAGPYCILGGEIKNSLIFGYSNKAHDGYLGDSVIGEWCNLGAGTSNSNLKNSGGSVKLWNPLTRKFADGGFKCGLMMGDYSRSSIHSAFNTGTVVGVSSHVFGNRATPAYLPSFSWGTDGEVYNFDKAILHISRWKKFKNKELSQVEIKQLRNIFDQKKSL